jgi:N,N-dimethylformamidase
VLRGYLDRFEAQPGSVLRARVAGAAPEPAVQVLKLSHADPHPAGPGFVAYPQEWPVAAVRAVSEQVTATGSLAIITDCFSADERAATLVLWVQPTRLDERNVIASWPAAGGSLQLVIRRGRFAVELAGNTGAPQPLLTSPHDLRERIWYFVAVGLNTELHSLLLAWGQSGRTGGPYVVTGEGSLLLRPRAGSALILGGYSGEGNELGADLDGKISAPALVRGTPDAISLMDIMNFGAQAAGAANVLAQWTFGADDDLDQVADLSGYGRHGRLLRAPSLGVTDPPELTSHRIPETSDRSRQPEYSTVHFHRDDLEDCGWPDTHEVTIPDTAPSGIYVLRVRDETGAADLPFIVTADAAAPVLLVVPTFTWQAYANLGRDPRAYPGLSHYAVHRDASPVYVSTRLKPIPTIEPGARIEVDGVDSFAGEGSDAAALYEAPSHLLMADLYVNRWLETTGVPFSVMTDGILHARGADALAGARTVVLSAHPEYWTAAMLDALESFIDGGGSVLYMGGNGLYWVTSVHPAKPHLLEVRRRGGSQTSSAPAGEERHVFDPQAAGGTWSASGRPPDKLVNVGFAGFGWDVGVPYQRVAGSSEDEFAWVFDGTGSDLLGERGLNMGGAVAFEFDRYSGSLAPPGTTVLATALPSQGGFFRSFEDGVGRAPDPLVRSDITIRRTPARGLVFSLGSIAASGCLTVADGQNDLARICTNVLLRTLS